MSLKDWVVLALWAVAFLACFVVGIGWTSFIEVFPKGWNLSSFGLALFVLGWIVRCFVTPRQ